MWHKLLVAFLLLTASTSFAVVGGGDITLKNKRGDVIFNHEAHVSGAGQKCTACHPKLYTNTKQHKAVTMKAMRSGKSCGSCHNGKTAFSIKADCAKCHKK
ncbi:MAG TPA: cytochrome c3 family protein [Geobacteraceae bacterium]